MTIKEAWEYISYGVKEGYFDIEDFKDMSDEKIIKFADKSEMEAQYRLDLYQENELTEDEWLDQAKEANL